MNHKPLRQSSGVAADAEKTQKLKEVLCILFSGRLRLVTTKHNYTKKHHSNRHKKNDGRTCSPLPHPPTSAASPTSNSMQKKKSIGESTAAVKIKSALTQKAGNSVSRRAGGRSSSLVLSVPHGAAAPPSLGGPLTR